MNSPSAASLRKHFFFSSTKVIPVTNTETASPRSVFRNGSRLRRRPSLSSVDESSNQQRSIGQKRCFPFSFELPRGLRPGEELPATYLSASSNSSSDAQLDISYRLVADWEPSDQQELSSQYVLPDESIIRLLIYS